MAKRGASDGLGRALWALVPLAVAVVAFRNRESLVAATRLLRAAAFWWLIPGAIAIGAVYLCRATVYGVPLRLLGYRFPRRLLWSLALVATTLHQLVPTAGASGYAFLTYALHQRGVSAGQASLIALIDTLSYAVAAGTLVLVSLGFIATGESGLGPGRVGFALIPGLAVVALALWLYWLQRDARRFVPLVLRLKDRLARLLGRRWPDEPVREFLGEYYRGKAVIRRHPRAFYLMVGLQYLAVAADSAALYTAFLTLGTAPSVWVTFMGFVVAMAGVAVLAVPGGGGGFEVIMSAVFVSRGIEPAQAIAATVLYRVLAFWLPALVSLGLLLRFRRRRAEVRAARGRR